MSTVDGIIYLFTGRKSNEKVGKKVISEIERHLTDVEAAARYRMSRAWFQRKRWEGGGPAYVKLPGRAGRCLYPIEELEAYFKAHMRTSTSDQGPAVKTAQNGSQGARVRKWETATSASSSGCSSPEEGKGGGDER